MKMYYVTLGVLRKKNNLKTIIDNYLENTMIQTVLK